MESLIDSRTRCILVNNPSNPCGSVYSEAHLRDIVALAEKHCLPIIADEIYGGIVFDGYQMHPLAAVSTNVPIITCGGLAKEFLVPGWRVGWIVVHDRNEILKEVHAGICRLATLTLGANTLVQNAIPAVLTPAPGSREASSLAAFHRSTTKILQTNAQFIVEKLADVSCLEVIIPQGGASQCRVHPPSPRAFAHMSRPPSPPPPLRCTAMYVMIRVKMDLFDDAITNDVQFTECLLMEESVFVLPGKCFGVANFVRVVLCVPIEKLEVACTRIVRFCDAHLKK